MAKPEANRLVVCVNNDGYSASLEQRKIYVALRDVNAEKHGLLRIIDEFRRRLSLSQAIVSSDCVAVGRQEGGPGGGLRVVKCGEGLGITPRCRCADATIGSRHARPRTFSRLRPGSF